MNDTFKNRSQYIRMAFALVAIILILRLAYIQLFDKDYTTVADAQALREVVQFPARGYIYDRNGKLIVYNEAVFDLMVVPSETLVRDKNDRKKYHQANDTALLCRKLGITHADYEARMEKARTYSPVVASIFMKQISKEEYASWQRDLYKFKGFYVQRRTLRSYTRPVGAHVLGYVGEVNDSDIKNDSAYYRRGDYIGQSGLEKTYENELRGVKGKTVMQVDVHSRTIGHYLDGKMDCTPIEGNNLYTSLDLDLQEYAEKLMSNKRGCVVAIEPSTGEVLALVSAPTYDPNLLVGRVRGDNYSMLEADANKPLYNRALQGAYPPGSIFKVAQAMAALQQGVITPTTGFACNKSLVGCHNHPSAGRVQDAIKMSCNPYFYNVYNRMIQQGKYKNVFKDSQYGLMVWRDYMLRFGFGQRLDIDLPNVKSGYIPDTSFYNKWYKGHTWSFSTIYSNSIGQGEVLVVPIQMANLACVVANRGYYITPHVVRYVGNDSVKTRRKEYVTKHQTGIDKRYFDIAVAGMNDVVYAPGGTGHRAAVPGISVCGKTGTAENYVGKVKRADHSVFIAFAPKDDPKIALSVYVENAAGGGGTWAAPIAGLIIEKYLKGTVERTEVERTYMEASPCQPLMKPKPATPKK
ncbi:MAG: penicillin-binding protein 2 [Bacteroidales bacterium]|nr:penicillin-binding protein 2 [Bacteroidales bacterium]